MREKSKKGKGRRGCEGRSVGDWMKERSEGESGKSAQQSMRVSGSTGTKGADGREISDAEIEKKQW